MYDIVHWIHFLHPLTPCEYTDADKHQDCLGRNVGKALNKDRDVHFLTPRMRSFNKLTCAYPILCHHGGQTRHGLSGEVPHCMQHISGMDPVVI